MIEKIYIDKIDDNKVFSQNLLDTLKKTWF